MSKSNALETQLLQHILQNADITLIGDATGLRGSSTPGSLYVSLHTSDPGETGTQETSECAYGSYARVAVPRSALGWDVTGDTGTNVDPVVFPVATSGSETATHFVVGTSATGAGKALYVAALTTPRAISTAVTAPTFAAGALAVTEG